MKYALAKELKNRGFPQVFHLKSEFEYDGYLDTEVNSSDHRVATPNLSELIEQCGKAFRQLTLHTNGTWTARKQSSYTSINSLDFEASSAEEAVAHLWLALSSTNNNKRP